MPLILRETINKSTILGTWKIDETAGALRGILRPDEDEAKYLDSFGSELRKKHWLAYRVVLMQLLDREKIRVVYDAYGKPGIPGFTGHFSVAHSGSMAAVIISHEQPVGIDIERVHNRIERVAGRFLTPEELLHTGSVCRVEKLLACWGAKEALYKLYGQPEIDFQNDILVKPFDYLCIGEGSGHADMKTPEGTGNYDFFYRKIEDYILTYAFSAGKNN